MIDTRGLLDQLLGGARDIAGRGENIAAGRLGVGDDPASRDSFRKGALGGAAAAGVLGLLLGTRAGRRIGTAGVAAGGLAALGKVAYDAWNRHQAQQGAAAPDAPPIADAPARIADGRARVLLSALVAAAKADGHVDAREMAMIRERIAPLGPEAQDFLIGELARPLDALALAAMAPDGQTAREIYTVTAAMCDGDNPKEREWMDGLGRALRIPPEVTADIEGSLARPA